MHHHTYADTENQLPHTHPRTKKTNAQIGTGIHSHARTYTHILIHPLTLNHTYTHTPHT